MKTNPTNTGNTNHLTGTPGANPGKGLRDLAAPATVPTDRRATGRGLAARKVDTGNASMASSLLQEFEGYLRGLEDVLNVSEISTDTLAQKLQERYFENLKNNPKALLLFKLRLERLSNSDSHILKPLANKVLALLEQESRGSQAQEMMTEAIDQNIKGQRTAPKVVISEPTESELSEVAGLRDKYIKDFGVSVSHLFYKDISAKGMAAAGIPSHLRSELIEKHSIEAATDEKLRAFIHLVLSSENLKKHPYHVLKFLLSLDTNFSNQEFTIFLDLTNDDRTTNSLKITGNLHEVTRYILFDIFSPELKKPREERTYQVDRMGIVKAKTSFNNRTQGSKAK